MRGPGWAAVLIALAACSSGERPATTPNASAATSAVAATTTTGTVAVPAGFEQVAATAVAADGTVCELCLWLADTPQLRSRGLMFVEDIGTADGMIFRYPSPTDRGFWMKNTRLALSIAYFDGEGRYVDALEMQPCTADPCPMYRIVQPYVDAIEVPAGGLEALGLTPGSTLTVHDLACQPDR